MELPCPSQEDLAYFGEFGTIGVGYNVKSERKYNQDPWTAQEMECCVNWSW